MGLNSPQRCPLSPLPMFQPRLPSCAALLLALGCWFPFSAVAQTLNVQNDVVRVANLVNTTATLSGTAELGRQIALAPSLTLRPFVEGQEGCTNPF